MTISVGRFLKSKLVKEHINKKCVNCKILCNLQELYTAFKKKKHPNVNIGFSNLCAMILKWYIFLKASQCNGLGLDIQKTDKINIVSPEVFSLKFICDHFYITINHKSIFLLEQY